MVIIILAVTCPCAMLYSLDSDLRVRFWNTNAFDVVDELKALFISRVRRIKYEWLDEFLSTKLEENACLESHLANMHGIHGRLVHVLDYWMTDRFAIDGVTFTSS